MTEGVEQIRYAKSDVFWTETETKASMTSNLIDCYAHKFPRRLIGVRCIKTGDGGAGDTIKLQKVTAAAVVTDISNAVDTSAKNAKTLYDFGTLDTAQMDFDNGDNLRILTVSDDLSMVYCTWAILQATP